MGKLLIMDPRKGHVTVEYELEKPETVAEAQRVFSEVLQLGYMAYEFPVKGGGGVATRQFNPLAEEVVMALPMAGG